MTQGIATPILLMNVHTRNIIKLHSVGEGERFLKLRPTTLYAYLKGNKKKPIKNYDGFFIKYANDLRPWPEKDAPYETSKLKRNLGKKVRVTNIATKEEVVCTSIGKTATFVNVTKYQIVKILTSRTKSDVFNGYRIEYLKESI